jgi:hypothetical protein
MHEMAPGLFVKFLYLAGAHCKQLPALLEKPPKQWMSIDDPAEKYGAFEMAVF